MRFKCLVWQQNIIFLASAPTQIARSWDQWTYHEATLHLIISGNNSHQDLFSLSPAQDTNPGDKAFCSRGIIANHSIACFSCKFCSFLTIMYFPFLCALSAATVSGLSYLTLLILYITSLIVLLNHLLNHLEHYWLIWDLELETLRIRRKVLSCHGSVTSHGLYSFRVYPNNTKLALLT